MQRVGSHAEQPAHLLVMWLLAALLSACGGTQATAPKQAASQMGRQPRSPDAWLREVERLIRRGRDQPALKVIAGARRAGVQGPRLLAFESVAHWRLGQHAKGAAAGRKLTAAVRRAHLDTAAAAVDPELWQTFEQLIAFHVQRRGAPAQAWRLLEPLLQDGCGQPRVCGVTRRVLVAWSQRPLELLARIDKAAPLAVPAPTAAQVKLRRGFVTALRRELIVARRWPEVDVLLRRAIAANPHNPQVWELAFYAARRRRGP